MEHVTKFSGLKKVKRCSFLSCKDSFTQSKCESDITFRWIVRKINFQWYLRITLGSCHDE